MKVGPKYVQLIYSKGDPKKPGRRSWSETEKEKTPTKGELLIRTALGNWI